MTMIDNKRPSKLYYFSEREGLERSLSLGEFRLKPPSQLPVQSPSANDANYLILSLAQSWDGALFDGKPNGGAYLIVHNSEEFGERVHRAAQKILPNWAGIDAAISYGAPSPLGRIFSQPKNHANEKEWRFAWRPMQAGLSARPVTIHLGSIADMRSCVWLTPDEHGRCLTVSRREQYWKLSICVFMCGNACSAAPECDKT